MKKIILIILLIFFQSSIFSQIVVTDGNMSTNTILQIANNIIGKGIKISNITYNGANLNQAGVFFDVKQESGYKSGSIFTNGRASIANAPNDSRGADANLNYSIEDADLRSIFNFSSLSEHIYDQFVLEFDFVAASDSLHINYVFGSEEYNEFIGYRNDGMGIFLSGPGIVGTKNIAILPDNNIIAVNNIHAGKANPVSLFDFYWENPKTDLCNNCQYFIFNPAYSNTMQYDGYTIPLKAKAKLIPCQTYHLKIAIADALDNVKDSGIMIEKGGISSNFLESSFQKNKDTIKICENEIRPVLTSKPIFAAYQWFHNQTFTGNTTHIITTTSAGFYQLNVTTSGNCTFSDSVYLKIGNPFVLNTNCKDTLICNFNVITIASKVNIIDTYSYKWSNYTSTNNYLTIQPLQTNTYTVSATNLGGCTVHSQVTISVNPVFYTQNITNSQNVICKKNKISIQSNFSATDVLNSVISIPSGVVYYWKINNNTRELGETNLVIKPTFIGINTIVSQIVSPEGCRFEDKTTFEVINKILQLKLKNDSICIGQKSQIFASFAGVNTYQWQYHSSFENTSTTSPVIAPTTTTTYKINVIYALPSGCTGTDSITIKVNPLPKYQKTSDTSVCVKEKINIKVESLNNTIQWKDSTYLTNNFDRIIRKKTNYYFKVITNSNCSINDSIRITANPIPIIKLNNDTSICLGANYQLKTLTFNGILTWKPDTDIENINTLSPVVWPTSTKKYFAHTFNTWGCRAKDSLSVVVWELPKLPLINTAQDFICDISQNYTTINAANFKKYLWNTLDTNKNIVIKKEGIYSLTVTDFNGCQNKDLIEIKRNCDGIYIISNIITPNNDGFNDSFVIQGIDENSTLEITNRWGMEVYHSNNYKNDWQANGLPDGMYYYKYYPKKSTSEFKGWIEVLR